MDHRIEKFIKVVEAESFTDAADHLHVSQPSLSVAIKKLEKELGARLIIRGGNFFQVTEEGKLVYDYGVQAKLNLGNLKAELTSEMVSQRTLRLGLIDSVAHLLFSSSSVDIAGKLEARIDNSSRLLRALKLDQLDMAIITKPLGSVSEDYRMMNVGEEPFVLVCAPDLATGAAINLKKNCLVEDFLTYDQSSTTFQWINKYFNENSLKYLPKFFSTSPELMLQMVLAGKGIALLPSSVAADGLRAEKLVQLDGVDFRRRVVATTLNGKFMSDEMLETVKSTSDCLN